MTKVKITVVKRICNQDLVDNYLADELKKKGFGQCDQFQDGDVFVLETDKKPEGFCSWAWADIQRDVVCMMFGGNFHWINKPGHAIACCTDGLRPVVFKIERID